MKTALFQCLIIYGLTFVTSFCVAGLIKIIHGLLAVFGNNTDNNT